MKDKTLLISWNVHGLGDPTKRRQANEMLWKSNVEIVCLQEHLLGEHEMSMLGLSHPLMDVFSSTKTERVWWVSNTSQE
eukprot:c38372_g1_i1 orf=67-303(+)